MRRRGATMALIWMVITGWPGQPDLAAQGTSTGEWRSYAGDNAGLQVLAA